MKILGIDPGIELTGFAIVEQSAGSETIIDCGVIRTDRGLSLPERLSVLHDDLQQLLAAVLPLDAVGVEEIFFSKNSATAFDVGHARGVILFTLHRATLPLYHIKPSEAKIALTGTGDADKKEVQKMIMLRFGLPASPQPDDAADAVAIALATAARCRQ